MAEGRSRAAWAHTSHLLCLIRNVNRHPRTRPLSPRDFNPHLARRPRPVSVERLAREILTVAESRKGRR